MADSKKVEMTEMIEYLRPLMSSEMVWLGDNGDFSMPSTLKDVPSYTSDKSDSGMVGALNAELERRSNRNC